MSHDHDHDHSHSHDEAQPLPEALDLSIPAAELSPQQLGRRTFLVRAGLLGAAAAGTTMVGAGAAAAAVPTRLPAPARPRTDATPQKYLWLVGDHHIHTNHSSDAQYLVSEQVQRSAQYGLDWMVITDHGSIGHQKLGVEQTGPEIAQARKDNARTLVFQGLEWNIPSAEHGTIFVAPGDGDVALLKEFEGTYDGTVTNTSASSAANEKLARDGLVFLQSAVDRNRVTDALFLANHPSRRGVDSPHEFRGWRDSAPKVAIGMEGAPGHQAAAIPVPEHATNGRGFYDNSPSANSFPGYPPESYVTYGGFDWITSTVGGLWDSMLAEGKPWWITANSDSHRTYLDTRTQGPGDVTTTGSKGAPVDTGAPIAAYGDFWPGYYSSTVVGSTDFSYRSVMAGIRVGRSYVVHGGLIGALSVSVNGDGNNSGPTATFGETTTFRRNRDVEVSIAIAVADRPNYNGDIPTLRKVDVIVGQIGGAVTDADTFLAPDTRVVQTFEIPANVPGGIVNLKHTIKRPRGPFYVRLRGSDGNRVAVGLRGAAIDPSGPQVDALGNADPWKDLWFYTNPVFVMPQA